MKLQYRVHPKYLNQYYSLNLKLRKRTLLQKIKILIKYLLLKLKILIAR